MIMNKCKLILLTLLLIPVSATYASHGVLITEVHAESATLTVSGLNLCGDDTRVSVGAGGLLLDNSDPSGALDVLSCVTNGVGFDEMVVTGLSLIESGSHRLIVDNSKRHSKKHSKKCKKSGKSCVDRFEFAFIPEGGGGSGGITQAQLDSRVGPIETDVAALETDLFFLDADLGLVEDAVDLLDEDLFFLFCGHNEDLNFVSGLINDAFAFLHPEDPPDLLPTDLSGCPIGP